MEVIWDRVLSQEVIDDELLLVIPFLISNVPCTEEVIKCITGKIEVVVRNGILEGRDFSQIGKALALISKTGLF